MTTDVAPRFADTYPFEFDGFQIRSLEALQRGRSVLVAAPTGAGKTVVGEYACHAALREDGKCFYTTPIKALSNQKRRDLIDRHGEDNVGLLTGDRSVNGEAPIVVMTTEVLRNMLYEGSDTLEGLRYVVLDEVHYLADVQRGAVWEEVLIQLPASVQVAALSATVSNAEEFGAWLDEVREGCEVVIEEQRPVPLRHHYFVNSRIYPTFKSGGSGGGSKKSSKERRRAAAEARGGVPNPEVVTLERREQAAGRRKMYWPDRPEVVESLAELGWLPAIIFVFSRRGCDRATEELAREGIVLTTREEREEIAELTDELLGGLPPEDLRVLDYPRIRTAMLDGYAPHHAGMVPAFKEAVELCFQRGLLKVVAATETLALGINMPAKTVVIERLEKWNGEQHVMLTPGQYTQLTGRAGRRGIDRLGHAIVLHQRDIDFRTTAGLVGTRTYPLSSSFAPSYNMAVNLLRRHDLGQAEDLLGASFAQFQADRSVSELSSRLRELREALGGYSQHLACERGDWAGYWAIRRELSDREKEAARRRRRRRGEALEEGLAQLRPGQVLHLPWIGHRGMVAVVGVHTTRKGRPLAQVVTDDHALTRIGPRELDTAPVVVDEIDLPNRGNPRQRDYRDIIASKLRQVEVPEEPWDEEPLQTGIPEQVEELRTELRAHPCHDCPQLEDHERWQHRADEVAEEAEELRAEIERRTGSLVRELHRIVQVLQQLGYLDEEPSPTEEGLRLARVYSEHDLLVAESIRRGLMEDLDAAELAGLASLYLYEPRGGDETVHPDLPTPALVESVDAVLSLAVELRGVERRAGLEPTGELDAGFVAPAWRWTSGRSLDAALGGMELTGGDFVRTVKQIADLVGQFQDVGDPDLARRAGRAVGRLRRGIVEA